MFKKIRQHKDFQFYTRLTFDTIGFVSFIFLLFVGVRIAEVVHYGA